MPAIQGFLGGTDVQRTLNLADNKCINMYPVTSDDGSITGFQPCYGLTQYAAIPNAALASGIYRASNGRCFMVANTILYEIKTGGTLTNLGSVTYGGLVTRMSDNGIHLIVVTGVDGWLFNFATADFRKIKVIFGTCAISNASPAIVTFNNHGFAAGDRLRFTTTGALPTGLATSTTYYVLAAGLTTNSFEVSLTDGGTAINTSSGGSGIHTAVSLGYGFPNGSKTVDYIDGRFIACDATGTQAFYCSEVLDGGYWDALNVQTADSNPDNIVCSGAIHNELVIFCEQSGEVYYDSGVLPSPFVRNVSGIFDAGCAAPYSVTRLDSSLFWVGKNSSGRGLVYRLNGYTPVRVSTYSIEYAMQAMSDISDAKGFAYQQDGHHFYVLTFPTGGKSFVFDVNTGAWHERAIFANGAFNRWEAQEYAFFDGKHLVCDYIEGKIYYIDPISYDYGGSARKWVRSFRAPSSDMDRAIHNKLTLEFEAGGGGELSTSPADSYVTLRWSNDGGHTWSNPIDKSLGALGKYATRVFWHRLGMTTGQTRIYEISSTSPVKTMLLNVYLD